MFWWCLTRGWGDLGRVRSKSEIHPGCIGFWSFDYFPLIRFSDWGLSFARELVGNLKREVE